MIVCAGNQKLGFQTLANHINNRTVTRYNLLPCNPFNITRPLTSRSRPWAFYAVSQHCMYYLLFIQHQCVRRQSDCQAVFCWSLCVFWRLLWDHHLVDRPTTWCVARSRPWPHATLTAVNFQSWFQIISRSSHVWVRCKGFDVILQDRKTSNVYFAVYYILEKEVFPVTRQQE